MLLGRLPVKLLNMELIRNPLKEDYDLDKMLGLGPVQPRNVVFKSTDVLVAGAAESVLFLCTKPTPKICFKLHRFSHETSSFRALIFVSEML
jgi:hypothetical protein